MYDNIQGSICLKFLIFLLSVYIFAILPIHAITDGIEPGIYIAEVDSSIGSGNSSTFIVYSATGLDVNVTSSSSPIFQNSNLTVYWSPSAESLSYNATLLLNDLFNPSLLFTPITVGDLGSANISLSSFGSDISPGFYTTTVNGVLGSGISAPFVISSSSPLIVTSTNSTAPVNSSVNITWSPSNDNGTASIYLLRLYDNSTIPILSNVTDTGNATIPLDVMPGAYLIVVNSTLSTGSTPLEVTSPLTVTLNPSNISSSNETTLITWTPYDPYQHQVYLLLSNTSGILVNLTINNTGAYLLDLSPLSNITPGLYNVTISSNVGSGLAPLIIFSSSGITVTSPNSSSTLYTNTTDTLFSWYPSNPDSGNATVLLFNLNTNVTTNFTVPNTGSTIVNLSLFNLPPGSYNATIVTLIGSGTSSPFVLKSPTGLIVIYPNSTTNASNNGLLRVIWTPENPAGSNASIILIHQHLPNVSYSFTDYDIGNITLNLANQTIVKTFNDFRKQFPLTPVSIKGTLKPRALTVAPTNKK